MFAGAQRVRDRQARIIQALQNGAVRFALSGSNATFAWIESVDDSAVRQYRNVEIIIDRTDQNRLTSKLSDLGLLADIHRDRIYFRNSSVQRERWADVALFAGEPMAGKKSVVPSLNKIEWLGNAPVISLRALVTFQLSRWLLDDRVDLRDLIDVGLVDASWLARLPAELGVRLKELLDDPHG